MKLKSVIIITLAMANIHCGQAQDHVPSLGTDYKTK